MYQIYALLSLMVMTWCAAIWASFDEPTGANKPGPYQGGGSKG